MPNAVHICQDMTSAPRILAGAFSAAKMGTVAPRTGKQAVSQEAPRSFESNTFQTHADTHKQASCEELVPVLRYGATDGCQKTKYSRDEDSTPTAKVKVDRIR